MMNALIVFLAQFATVFLLVWQSRCVRDSQYVLAAANSIGLGICGVIITPAIAKSDLLKSSPLILAAFLCAGPLAVCCAIFLHDRRFGRVDYSSLKRNETDDHE